MVDCPVYGMGNDCYVEAIACFLQVSYFEAFVIANGGIPPGECSDVSRSLNSVTENLKAAGLVVGKKKYEKKKKPALVVVQWKGFYCCRRLHMVVWTGKR